MLPDSSMPIHSENTSLIHGRGKHKKNVFARALFLQFLVASLVIGGLAVFERQLWQQELTRRRQREDWWHREEEARQKLGLYWDTPVADSHCTAHNTREYWAHLLNTVPFEYNWLKACQDIPLVIHGKSLNTTRCYINPHVSSLSTNHPSISGDNGSQTPGEVYGHWLVEFNEPSCSPYWDRFKDKVRLTFLGDASLLFTPSFRAVPQKARGDVYVFFPPVIVPF